MALAQIEEFFRDLITCLQIAKLYTIRHPRFGKFLDKAFASLDALLKEKQEVLMGIVGDELAYEKEIFFNLSTQVKPIIMFLKARGIEKIAFYRGATKEELGKFVEFLALPKEESKIGIIKFLQNAGVKNIAVGRITVSSESEGEETPLQMPVLAMYQNASEQADKALEAMMQGEAVDYLNLRFLLNSVLDGMAVQHREMLMLANIKRYDLSTFMHSLNVSILSMYFSAKIGLNKDDILDIGIASLLHDIGKLYISRGIIKKTGKLTDEEFAAIKSHVLLGAQMLLKYVDTIGVLPVVVSFEHHLKFNLSGYPKAPFTKPQHLASQIVSICDVYDALYQRRNYKNDYAPDVVYQMMIKDRNTAFEQNLLDEFFRIMGIWPVGTLVGLSNQNIAVVKEENPEEIALPKVQVVRPKEERKMLDLRETRDTIKIEKFINPWKEGKELMDEIHKELS